MGNISVPMFNQSFTEPFVQYCFVSCGDVGYRSRKAGGGVHLFGCSNMNNLSPELNTPALDLKGFFSLFPFFVHTAQDCYQKQLSLSFLCQIIIKLKMHVV